MSDYRPVNHLRASLASALSLRGTPGAAIWTPADKPMTKVLRLLQEELGNATEPRPQTDQMVAAVRDFMRDQRVRNFNQLKYVCYGLSVPLDADNTRLIDRKPLFARLLELVGERQDQAKTYRRCYQGLLAGYFGFEHRVDDRAMAGANWLTLRGFLADRLQDVLKTARSRDQVPLWLSTLAEHSNLLQDKPCTRYVDALRRGSTVELKNVCMALAIESSSWVWHEAVLAYVIDVVEEKQDTAFKAELRKVLDMVQDTDKDRRLPEAIAKSAAAFLVMRYARCQDKPEHPLLRDACLSHIGNPWLQRAAWDGVVKDEAARRMVESWLKRGLIKDFFELLAHDGAADPRRLNYWLKWEPQISDMWFVLGSSARRNQSAAFLSLKKRMSGRDRALTGATDDGNNAFVMRLGNLLVIEFGLTGNACYAFHADNFKADLDAGALNIHALKQRLHAHRMSHVGPWEARFDLDLRGAMVGAGPPVLARVQGIDDALSKVPVPTTSAERPQPKGALGAALDGGIPRPPWPSFTSSGQQAGKSGWDTPVAKPLQLTWASWDEIRRLCRTMGIEVADNRVKGGAAWVYWTEGHRQGRLMDLLLTHGFKYLQGKGFHNDSEV